EAEGDCSERRNARQAGVSLEITRAAPFGAALRCLLWLRGFLWLGSLQHCFFRLAHARRRGFWGAASLGFTLLEELQKRGLARVRLRISASRCEALRPSLRPAFRCRMVFPPGPRAAIGGLWLSRGARTSAVSFRVAGRARRAFVSLP